MKQPGSKRTVLFGRFIVRDKTTIDMSYFLESKNLNDREKNRLQQVDIHLEESKNVAVGVRGGV